MSRYIDADEALRMIRNSKQDCPLVDDKKGIWDVAHNCAISCVEAIPTADVVEIPEGGIGNLSDGYHTFNELYHHRAILFSVICNSIPNKAWKSKLHDTGDMYEGMFIVGIETPEGQATYHYDIDPYWDMFKVKELEKAPKWDGHTPQEAIERIAKISTVTRCLNCKQSEATAINGVRYCFKKHEKVRCEDFCSKGERKDDD